jgi:hypothetical protein
MSQPNVAVLDTGIDFSQLIVNTANIRSVTISEKARQPGPHAALVINILGTVCPEAMIHHVGIMDPNGSANGLELYQGLQWCLQKPDLDIVCLSLCYRHQEPIPEIEEILEKLHQRGIIVIASRHNNYPGEPAYPADCLTTIGVDQLAGINLGSFKILDNEHKILGMNGHGIVTQLGAQKVALNGNSFSAPILAARIANSRRQGKCLNLENTWQVLAG